MSDQNQPVKKQETTPSRIDIKQTHFKGEIFQSNYPPPEMMEKYAQIDPKFPDRLFRMAEKEGRHRRQMERLVAVGSVVLDFLGLIFAPAVVAGILYVGWLFMKAGNANSGAWIIGTVTVALALAFITRGRHSKTPKK